MFCRKKTPPCAVEIRRAGDRLGMATETTCTLEQNLQGLARDWIQVTSIRCFQEFVRCL